MSIKAKRRRAYGNTPYDERRRRLKPTLYAYAAHKPPVETGGIAACGGGADKCQKKRAGPDDKAR